jgi:hypothetical protein
LPRPGEIAPVGAVLADEKAGTVTGSNIRVNGELFISF